MDTSALLSKKDPLAAQLTKKAPSGANVQRVSFARVLDGSRDKAEGYISNAERTAKETVQSTRSAVIDKVQDDEGKGLTVRDYMDRAGEPAQQTAPRDQATRKDPADAPAHRDSTRPAARTEETASTSDTGAPAAATETGQTATSQIESTVSQIPGSPIPTTPAQAIELPATLLMAAVPAADPQQAAAPATTTPAVPGVALAGNADDATLPALVAPLNKPAANGAGQPAPATGKTSPAAAQSSSAPSADTLVGALVGKVTARGQNQALNAQTDTAGASQATAPANSEAASAPIQAATAPITKPMPGLQPAVAEGNLSVAIENTLTNAAAQPEQLAQPRIRATATRGGEPTPAASANGIMGQDGPQTVPHNPNAGAQTGARPVTENLAQPNAQSPVEAALPNAQDQSALAARATADPVSRSLDAVKGAAEPVVQNVGATSGTGATSAEAAARAAAAKFTRPATPPAPVAEQVAVRISKAVAQGADRIEIQLKPASLGNVRVAMEVGHDGRVLAVVSADRAETLDMLKQDSRSLERALQDAGLKADSNSLSFNLRGGDGRQPQAGDSDGGSQQFSLSKDEPDGNLDPAAIDPARYAGGSGLVDIHV